eukprot:GGOE01054754.1.p1 GENE.GGOE01054754.1~~GGOE01054754.1.p1  ORF type:complete len:504 (-),score=112.93 GGOE01054754.1:263-1774(-)
MRVRAVPGVKVSIEGVSPPPSPAAAYVEAIGPIVDRASQGSADRYLLGLRQRLGSGLQVPSGRLGNRLGSDPRSELTETAALQPPRVKAVRWREFDERIADMRSCNEEEEREEDRCEAQWDFLRSAWHETRASVDEQVRRATEQCHEFQASPLTGQEGRLLVREAHRRQMVCQLEASTRKLIAAQRWAALQAETQRLCQELERHARASYELAVSNTRLQEQHLLVTINLRETSRAISVELDRFRLLESTQRTALAKEQRAGAVNLTAVMYLGMAEVAERQALVAEEEAAALQAVDCLDIHWLLGTWIWRVAQQQVVEEERTVLREEESTARTEVEHHALLAMVLLLGARECGVREHAGRASFTVDEEMEAQLLRLCWVEAQQRQSLITEALQTAAFDHLHRLLRRCASTAPTLHLPAEGAVNRTGPAGAGGCAVKPIEEEEGTHRADCMAWERDIWQLLMRTGQLVAEEYAARVAVWYDEADGWCALLWREVSFRDPLPTCAR